MSKKPNQNNEEKAINKVEEPKTEYSVDEQIEQEEELHPVLIELLKKSKQQAKEGKGIPHDEVMKRMKEKFPFLK